MIYSIDRKLYENIDDTVIRSALGEFGFKVCKVKKGYYVYNKDADQVAQIRFEPYTAYITVADSGTLCLTRHKKTCDYDIAPMTLEGKDKKLAEYQNRITGEYAMAGSYEKMMFDIYFRSKCVLNVIPDPQDDKYVKIRVNEGGNLVMCVMLVVAICKLNDDPKSEI